ncbi:MAG: hypothetical protein CVV41_17930 [Candidatus Riflebacteria bacterium HGW-Riflebacteria-1]|jgi:hypothetical protein|nr:MAG: hypothetical protein CVV41_17930 [Candidatus Riflebacteria bacterium HGW-Riflebacteria-1]
MNCNEFKVLLSECESLADLGQLPEVTAHLKDCAACRSVLLYEGKLRQGFAGIAGEAAPPDLAARIMAIQSEQAPESAKSAESAEPGWFDLLLSSLQGFPFKVAFAAGLTGFFAAFLLLRQPQLAPLNEPATIATHQEQAVPATGRDEAFQLAKTEEQPLPASHNKSLQFDAPAVDAKRDSSDSGSMQLAMTPKEEAAAPADAHQIAESSEERIPGAVTFALDSSSDTFIADKTAGAAAVSLADEPDASEPEMQLAMSPAAERETARSVKPSAPARFASPPPSGETRARITASQKMSESKNKKLELSNELFAETESSDPLADELRKLLEANAIDLPEGFISLDELAMRGYLPAEKLRRLRPPTGSGWYLQKTTGQLRIFLKKR